MDELEREPATDEFNHRSAETTRIPCAAAVMARSRQKHSGPVQRRDLRRRPSRGHQDRSPRPPEARAQRLAEIEAWAWRANGMSEAVCHQCGKPLPPTT